MAAVVQDGSDELRSVAARERTEGREREQRVRGRGEKSSGVCVASSGRARASRQGGGGAARVGHTPSCLLAGG